jgi:hypothetical protein
LTEHQTSTIDRLSLQTVEFRSRNATEASDTEKVNS